MPSLAGEGSRGLMRSPFTSSALLANLANFRYRRTVSWLALASKSAIRRRKKIFSTKRGCQPLPVGPGAWRSGRPRRICGRNEAGLGGLTAPGGLLFGWVILPPRRPTLHFLTRLSVTIPSLRVDAVEMAVSNPRHLSDSHSAPSRMQLPITVRASCSFCAAGYSLRFRRSIGLSQACQGALRGEAERERVRAPPPPMTPRAMWRVHGATSTCPTVRG
jgi:hypothetical protein